MQIFNEIMPLKSFLLQKRKENLRIGLVPTMGALHEGHLSLIKECRRKCDITVVSIFVNPTQFNNAEDYEKYPVTFEEDCSLLKEENTDILFAPEVGEIYQDKGYLTLNFGRLEQIMEGKFRPGHFSGVGLIVSKLFNIVCPDIAFFGQKDLQQVAVIKKLNEELCFGIDLQVGKTVRDTDGLALSSRNKRLNPEQRSLAPVLYRSMCDLKEQVLNGKSVNDALTEISDELREHPGIELEYMEVVDSIDLSPVSDLSHHEEVSVCIAAYFGEVRLIDNLFLISR